MTGFPQDLPEIVIFPDEEALAAAAARQLIAALVDAQRSERIASVVLTGGGIATKQLEQVATGTNRDDVNWGRVEFWWGDERFVPVDDDRRNERAARAALLDRLPVDPTRVHPMGSSDAFATPEDAADAYADALTAAGNGTAPAFDVLLLGMGPEGHVASLFPEQPAVHDERLVVAVHGCPKPPPTRVSLTFAAIGAAREVWLIVSGAQKADAVALAVSGAGPFQVPAAAARGRQRTRLLLDEAAAAQLPAGLPVAR